MGGLSGHEHLLLFAKVTLVGSSWLLGYFGIRLLPLFIATPIRATGPLWTITLAVSFLLGIFMFRERHIRPKGACVLGIIAGLLLLA